MPKWKAVRIRQELAEEASREVERSDYQSLSKFVSDAIRRRLQTLAKQRIWEHLERASIVGMRTYTCTNSFVHNIKVVKYEDSSVWVMCPMFGWFEDASSRGTLKLGCQERKKRCTWFIG